MRKTLWYVALLFAAAIEERPIACDQCAYRETVRALLGVLFRGDRKGEGSNGASGWACSYRLLIVT